ncbi:MAG: Serine hydroxymethyltransferase (EC [uncultured Caballeronia sp.]|nr:MAG: Serine hydroxymethyltransferase (EC [uncultured Caballeronia sp.]
MFERSRFTLDQIDPELFAAIQKEDGARKNTSNSSPRKTTLAGRDGGARFATDQ